MTPGQYTLEKNTEELDVYEGIIFGSLYLIKHMDDGSTGLETVEAGAEFEVFLKTAGSYENARDTERDYLITDEHGYAGTKQLPYGVYTVRQTKGTEGFDLAAPFDVLLIKTDAAISICSTMRPLPDISRSKRQMQNPV